MRIRYACEIPHVVCVPYVLCPVSCVLCPVSYIGYEGLFVYRAPLSYVLCCALCLCVVCMLCVFRHVL
ncbi:hypothetical protein B484DRAFT_204185 [Ochromonadaceae sp. CCMP2298]|nr:hypothetical protein B484DRAFT_204185 [Ochromonadaceae sp. CCMP2298]